MLLTTVISGSRGLAITVFSTRLSMEDCVPSIARMHRRQGSIPSMSAAAHALMADGTVRFISENTSGLTIASLITARGGEITGDF